MRKIPKGLTLPGGYKVKVRIVVDSAFSKMGMADSDAFWNVDNLTIYLRKSRGPAERFNDYMHELDHVWTDYKGWYKGDYA